MHTSLRRSLIFSCLLGVALDAQTPNVKPRSATDGGELWNVTSKVISIPFRYDEGISDKAAAIWTRNMARWEKLTRGRVDFKAVTSEPPAGNWLQLKALHARIQWLPRPARRDVQKQILRAQIVGPRCARIAGGRRTSSVAPSTSSQFIRRGFTDTPAAPSAQSIDVPG